MLKWALPLFTIVAVGCGAGPATKETAETGSVGQAIVGGSISTTVQDAAVLLAMPDELCTGTLIAPNLVLTARHCVAPTPDDGADECVAYGATVSPSTVSIYAGIDANPDIHTQNRPIATGAKIMVPQTSNMCSFDVALVQLDRSVAGRIAEVRFTELAPNEPVIAVGYGVDGNDQTPPQRMQRQTTILGVGATAIPYTTRRGLKVTYDAPPGDVVTGESTCFGDSGGPLFDAQGRVVAVTSRGIPQLFPEDKAQFGNGCIDQPSVFAGVRFNEALIREAARAAGHELPRSDAAPASSPAAGELAGDDDDEASSGDDDDDDSKKKSSSKKKRAALATAPAAATCASRPLGQPAGSSLPIVGLGLAFVALRRRSLRGG